MEFIRVGNTLVNINRLLAVQHKPQVPGAISTVEHYRAVFDTGQDLWLTPIEGEQIVNHGKFRAGNLPEGNTAITSEATT